MINKLILKAIISASIIFNLALSQESEMNNTPFIIADPAATFNNNEISKDEIMYHSIMVYGSPIHEFPDKSIAEELISSYILQNILANKAIEAGMEDNQYYQTQLKNIRTKLLTDIYINTLSDEATKAITEEDLKNAYNNRIEKITVEPEYGLLHILMPEKSEAEQVLKDIKDNKITFSNAAEQYSIEASSAIRGGDMGGWFGLSTFEPIIAETLKTLEKNTLTPEVIETDFGYHIMYVKDIRETPIPTLEQLTEELKAEITMGKVEEQIKTLQDEIHFEINESHQ